MPSRSLLIVLGLACAPVYGQSWTHLSQISLAAHFNTASDLGDNPLSLAFDGAHAYVGGYNNLDTGGLVGLLKVENVLGTPQLQPLASSVQLTGAYSGYNELIFEATTGDLFTNLDQGSVNTAGNLVERRRTADGALVWQVNPFSDATGTLRVKALAIDVADALNGPFLAALAVGHGRRLGLSLQDGAYVYGPSGSLAPGGILLGDVNGTVDFGTVWQAFDMDADGNIVTVEQDYVGYALRDADNVWRSPSGRPERQDEILRRDPQAFPGDDVVILEDLLEPGLGLLAIALRNATSLTLLDGSSQAVDGTSVLLRQLDGTADGLSQTALFGNEDGVGAGFASGIKGLAAGADPQGRPTLLILDFGGRTLDVYQFGPSAATCDFDSNGACELADLNALLAIGPIAHGIPVVTGQNDAFDLTGDGIIDAADLDQWLADAGLQNGQSGSYARGDANLDGVVDVSDFNLWNGGKFSSSLRWDRGDFNGDGQVDVSDFNLWNGNKFTSSAAGGTVPEPAAALVCLWAAAALATRRHACR